MEEKIIAGIAPVIKKYYWFFFFGVVFFIAPNISHIIINFRLGDYKEFLNLFIPFLFHVGILIFVSKPTKFTLKILAIPAIIMVLWGGVWSIIDIVKYFYLNVYWGVVVMSITSVFYVPKKTCRDCVTKVTCTKNILHSHNFFPDTHLLNLFAMRNRIKRNIMLFDEIIEHISHFPNSIMIKIINCFVQK